MKRLILAVLAIVLSACAIPTSKVENNAEVYNNRGLSWHKKGDYDKAISAYTKAIELNPEYAEAYCNRGPVYTEKGQYDRGIPDRR